MSPRSPRFVERAFSSPCFAYAIALDNLSRLKRAGKLCEVIGALPGFNAVCGSEDFLNELDRRVLCEILCCCRNVGKQACVRDVLWLADWHLGGQSYYKAEVPYLGNQPRMSRSEPGRPTRGRPGGSRIPDVVVVQDPTQAPSLDNIQRVYEMKFPPDRYASTRGPDGQTQQRAYEDIFGKKLKKEPLTPENCHCDDQHKRPRVLKRAMAWQRQREKAIDMTDEANRAAAAAAIATITTWLAPEVAFARAIGLAF